jgi:hypothetical protein
VFIIPWSRVLLQKPIVAQLVNKCPISYENRKVIIVFTRVLSWIYTEPVESNVCGHNLLLSGHIVFQTAPCHAMHPLYTQDARPSEPLDSFILTIFDEDENGNQNPRIVVSNYEKTWLNSQQFGP